ncbi:MAG TPA: hypothetical protein VF813_06070, partial [Anaerolineaceae bacterium]
MDLSFKTLPVKILTVSDVQVNLLYSPRVQDRFADVDLIVSCGDLPYYYLEYIISMLDVPLVYVFGNHHNQEEHSSAGTRSFPWGGINPVNLDRTIDLVRQEIRRFVDEPVSQ